MVMIPDTHAKLIMICSEVTEIKLCEWVLVSRFSALSSFTVSVFNRTRSYSLFGVAVRDRCAGSCDEELATSVSRCVFKINTAGSEDQWWIHLVPQRRS